MCSPNINSSFPNYFSNISRLYESNFKRIANSQGNEKHYVLKQELNETMDKLVGIFRNAQDLQAALGKVKELKERFSHLGPPQSGLKFNHDLLAHLELEANIDVAEAIVIGALMRKESRGSHSRKDFPTRNDNEFLKHTLVSYDAKGPITAKYKPVMIDKYQPEERKY